MRILFGTFAGILPAQTNAVWMVSANSLDRTISKGYFAKPNALTIIVVVCAT